MVADVAALEAGPRMDMAVTRAIGLSARLPEGSRAVCGAYDKGVRLREPFCPSTDWNDAMFAAEEFELLDQCESHGDRPHWGASLQKSVPHHYDEWSVVLPDGTHTEAPTGPLAICRAILTLHARGH